MISVLQFGKQCTENHAKHCENKAYLGENFQGILITKKKLISDNLNSLLNNVETYFKNVQYVPNSNIIIHVLYHII